MKTKTPNPDEPTNKASLKALLNENYPLLAIIAGFVLVAVSLGPYTNGDTAWEMDAVSGVLKWGLPYANGFNLIDQPPVGFYIQAAFAGVFGLSVGSGTFLATLFGLGCIVSVYAIGYALYNRLAGVFAAALFAFSPWHLILSRAFLIDVQSLFFSLLSLAVGIFALQRGSFKLFLASGIIFAVAFNTKLYAIFTLIPLLALFLYYRPKKAKQMLGWLAAFSVPTVISSFLWYQTVAGINMGAIVSHTDFSIQNPSGVVPSPFFATNFLTSYGLGWLFIDAAILSVIICLALRQRFRRFLVVDLVCLAVIICVVGVDTYLGAALNLKAPYQNAVKYCYQALPFFALIVGSLVSKSVSLFSLAKTNVRLKKAAITIVAFAGLALAATSLIYNMRFDHLFSTADYLLFRVEPTVNLGYSLFNFAPLTETSTLMIVQYVGFAVALSGLVWLSRNRLKQALKLQK